MGIDVAPLDPAGWLRLELPQLDNTENAMAVLTVDPAYRRRGVGRALHGHGLRLLGEAGREPSPARSCRTRRP